MSESGRDHVATWRSPGLARVSLSLATPQLLSDCLALYGFRWSPEEPTETRTTDAGMYAWVDGKGGLPPMNSGVIYVGTGEGTGGVWGRLENEVSWRGGDHAHGLAIERLRATPLGGPVLRGSMNLGFLDDLVRLSRLKPGGPELIRKWICEDRTRDIRKVENLAVRLCIHLGDVGSPVNSQWAGAWANDTGADWAAFAAVEQLRRLHQDAEGG